VIHNLLTSAERYVYLSTPYLILDHDLCRTIENTALRGVDVRIVVPHIPDKRYVFEITRSYYPRLLASGVRIYEYTPGFIHAKTYVADDRFAVIGTINLDYRSLVHHFENGVWIYDAPVIYEMRDDLLDTIGKSEEIFRKHLSISPPRRLFRSVLRIFSPLL
jgi:cardiolipin synthase